jgi:hypothetical protein
MPRNLAWMVVVFLVVGVVTACTGDPRVEDVVVHRDNCLVCHQPRNANGVPEGIEDAHPGYPLTCQDCHGGNPRLCDGTMGTANGEPTCSGAWVYDKARAHVQPVDGRRYLKNLSTAELDLVDRAYLQFINPGDLRVVEQTCGQCHAEQVEMVKRSTMSHTSGEVTVARYRAGAQGHAVGVVAGAHVVDPNHDPQDQCSVASLEVYNPPPVDLHSKKPEDTLNVANAQETYMVKSCMRCHTRDFGENRFKGDFRSSGCTSCHMLYAEDGRSGSGDPRINKQTTPHPVRHEITSAIPVEQCTRCHYRGGRLGNSYQGFRESSGSGLNPPAPSVLGRPLHGHDPGYYLTDEDPTNTFDETPPDVHFEAGMHCIDCHTRVEIHGDGHLYADTQCIVKTRCEDCHGTVRQHAVPAGGRDNLFLRDGQVWLRGKVTGLEWPVTQVKDLVTAGHEKYSADADEAMGVGANGRSHTDSVECYTCHAGWAPNCYGCHVDVDLTRQARVQTTGALTDGYPAGSRKYVALNDLILMWNASGKLAPSMPAERFFMTVQARDEQASAAQGRLVKKKVINTEPRAFTLPSGEVMPGFGQRAFNPHTTRRRSTFMACNRCHSVGSATAPDNGVLLDLTHGFGTQRFPFLGCDIQNEDRSCNPDTDFKTYQLDAVLERDGRSLVVVGHPFPQFSRPLTLEEIQRMRDVVVDADRRDHVDIPVDAVTNRAWPPAVPMD